MRKLTRDEERFKACLKKSKSKTIHLLNEDGRRVWYFKDVDQTGWHHDAIGQMIDDGIIKIGLMQGHGNQPVYHDVEWVGKRNETLSHSSNRNNIRIWRSN